jgi:hypothetical protein
MVELLLIYRDEGFSRMARRARLLEFVFMRVFVAIGTRRKLYLRVLDGLIVGQSFIVALVAIDGFVFAG